MTCVCPGGCVIVTEGNIGAGKTTFCDSVLMHNEKLFGYGRRVDVLLERVNPVFLQKFLSDQKRYGFHFQLHMAEKRVETMRRAISLAQEGHIVLVDRGLVGDSAFAKLHLKRGNILPEDWALYQSIMQEGPGSEGSLMYEEAHVKNYVPRVTTQDPPIYLLYLRTSVENAMERIRNRNRDGEVNGYSTEYIQSLSDAYDEACEEAKSRYKFLMVDHGMETIEDSKLELQKTAQILNKLFQL